MNAKETIVKRLLKGKIVRIRMLHVDCKILYKVAL